MEDIGSESAKKSPGISELAKCQETTSERDVRKVVESYGLSLPIAMTMLPKTPGVMYEGNIHVLSLRHWMEYIVSHNVWRAMVGLKSANATREKAILSEFWRRYRLIRPSHEIFQRADAGLLDLSRCAPLLIHGDEGRGRRNQDFSASHIFPT